MYVTLFSTGYSPRFSARRRVARRPIPANIISNYRGRFADTNFEQTTTRRVANADYAPLNPQNHLAYSNIFAPRTRLADASQFARLLRIRGIAVSAFRGAVRVFLRRDRLRRVQNLAAALRFVDDHLRFFPQNPQFSRQFIDGGVR